MQTVRVSVKRIHPSTVWKEHRPYPSEHFRSDLADSGVIARLENLSGSAAIDARTRRVRFGLQWFALNMAGTLLQSSPRGGNNGHRLAIERREGEDCWTIECAGYCYHSSERIRSPRRITRTSQDERIGASEDFCGTESALGKNKGPQGCPDQSRQATYFSSGISEYQSGN